MHAARHPPPDAAGAVLEELRSAYLAAILAPDARLARRLVLDAADAGTPAARLYLEVLRPTLQELGHLWETAQVGMAQEQLATQITQSVLAELAVLLAGDQAIGDGRRVIVSCTPGELHGIGGQMVADFLEADGWDVTYLGPGVTAAEVARLAGDGRAEVVALSTALPVNLPAAREVCEALRRLPRQPFIVAGGRAYGGDRPRARAGGADGLADGPEELLELLATRLGAAGAGAG